VTMCANCDFSNRGSESFGTMSVKGGGRIVERIVGK
jgi:hypothetical protein